MTYVTTFETKKNILREGKGLTEEKNKFDIISPNG